MGEETVHQKLGLFGQGRSVGHGRASAELGTRRKRGKKAERADALRASRAATGQNQCQQNGEPRRLFQRFHELWMVINSGKPCFVPSDQLLDCSSTSVPGPGHKPVGIFDYVFFKLRRISAMLLSSVICSSCTLAR